MTGNEGNRLPNSGTWMELRDTASRESCAARSSEAIKTDLMGDYWQTLSLTVESTCCLISWVFQQLLMFGSELRTERLRFNCDGHQFDKNSKTLATFLSYCSVDGDKFASHCCRWSHICGMARVIDVRIGEAVGRDQWSMFESLDQLSLTQWLIDRPLNAPSLCWIPLTGKFH